MGSLEGHLNKTRVQRIQVERLRTLQDAVVAHYAAFPRNASMDCRPRYIEFAIADECRALVEAPVSQPITHEDFTTLIPRLATNWQEEKAAMLRQSLRSEFSLGERSEVDPLDLAIAMWVCTTCLMHLRYPAVLAHSCAYTPDRFDFFQDEYLRAAVYLNAGPKLCATLACKPYDFVRIAGYRHKKQVLDRMVGIISAMGLEPKSATVKDLEECKVRLRCVRCREKGPGQGEVYSWEAAVSYPCVVESVSHAHRLPCSSNTPRMVLKTAVRTGGTAWRGSGSLSKRLRRLWFVHAKPSSSTSTRRWWFGLVLYVLIGTVSDITPEHT